LRRLTWLLKNRTDLDVPKSNSAIAYATNVTGRIDVVLNLKEKNLFLFLDLLRMAAEILTMCCFFGSAWVRPCCIGMIRVDS
jgi:hypothetical protein